MNIIWFLLVGALVGWLAGLLWEGHGFGIVGNIVVGIFGALIGQWVFSQFGVVAHSFLGSLVVSIIGAGVLLFIAGLFRSGRRSGLPMTN